MIETHLEYPKAANQKQREEKMRETFNLRI